MDNDLKYLFNVTISKIKEIAQENLQKIFSGDFSFILKIKCYSYHNLVYLSFLCFCTFNMQISIPPHTCTCAYTHRAYSVILCISELFIKAITLYGMKFQMWTFCQSVACLSILFLESLLSESLILQYSKIGYFSSALFKKVFPTLKP